MDKQKAAAEILSQALKLAPFEGWTQQTLSKAALAAGYKKTDAIRVFPGGAIQAVETLFEHYNQAMVQALLGYHLDTMKIRERIATAVRLKLEIMEPDREAVRRALALIALPFYCQSSLRNLYKTVDDIWYSAGDTSTDFNFYTKRLMLAGVYSTTLTFWLDDTSASHEATWAFLDRRIEDVMQIEKAKRYIKSGDFWSFLKRNRA